MLYREIVAVCSAIHTKHINTLCGQNVELLNFETHVLWSNYQTSAFSVCFRSVNVDLPFQRQTLADCCTQTGVSI